MWNDGIRVVVPFWRTDPYGNGLYLSMKQNIETFGGSVVDGVPYVLMLVNFLQASIE